MSLIAIRKKNKAAWMRLKKSTYYCSLVVSPFSLFYALLGFAFADTESSYVDEYSCLVVFAVSSLLAWTLRSAPGEIS
jgi:hypothetical protein